MKVSKTLIQAMLVAVTVGTTVSCTKSVDSKPEKANIKTSKTGSDSTVVTLEPCFACGMG